MRVDDTVETNIQPVNREYWQGRGSNETVKIADELLKILNEQSTVEQKLNYTKHYIGLTDGQRTSASIYFKPRKNYCHVTVRAAWTEEDLTSFEDVDLDVDTHNGNMRIKLRKQDLKKHRELITPLLHRIVHELGFGE